MIRIHRIACSLAAVAAVASAAALPASAEGNYTLTIGDQGFQPGAIEIPANEKLKLTVSNKTKKPAEFESAELGREKLVPAGGSISIPVGPLKAGTYKFFDDFNPSHAGTITVK